MVLCLLLALAVLVSRVLHSVWEVGVAVVVEKGSMRPIVHHHCPSGAIEMNCCYQLHLAIETACFLGAPVHFDGDSWYDLIVQIYLFTDPKS